MVHGHFSVNGLSSIIERKTFLYSRAVARASSIGLYKAKKRRLPNQRDRGREEIKLCVQVPNPKWNTFTTGKGLLSKAGHLLSSFELLGL